MGRPTRSITPDSWHHVMNRGADRQDIFTDDVDRLRLEQLLGDMHDGFGVEIAAYCLMTNHVHLLAHCHDDKLSEAMQHLAGNHARAYNERHGRSGPLFGDRYKSVAVHTDEQLLTAARYIHRNPLDIVSLRTLPAYRWSSLGAYLGRRPAPGWLSTTQVDALLGGRDHWRFVAEPLPTDLTPPHGVATTSPPTIEQVERAVACAAGITTEAIHRSDQGVGNPARTLVLTLAVELRSGTAASLAVRYGLASASVVRVAARRGRVRLHDDPAFRRLRDRVIGNLLRGGLTPP